MTDSRARGGIRSPREVDNPLWDQYYLLKQDEISPLSRRAPEGAGKWRRRTMIRITRMTDYAIVLLGYFAQNTDSSIDGNRNPNFYS